MYIYMHIHAYIPGLACRSIPRLCTKDRGAYLASTWLKSDIIYIYIYTYTHTYIHMYIYMHIHTYIPGLACRSIPRLCTKDRGAYLASTWLKSDYFGRTRKARLL